MLTETTAGSGGWALGPKVLATLAGGLTLLIATDASAYCRTTTCDPESDGCASDRNGCSLTGIPLFWPDLCVTFGVHEQGSTRRGISYDRAEDATRRAFQTWISADCGDGLTPSIGVVSLGKMVCDRIEYNHDTAGRDGGGPKVAGPNANLIVFRDDEWPYPDVNQTIALTTITFAVSSGEILDADIEVNSVGMELTTGDVNVRNDLQSVMTHEVGHFFGLAHTLVPGASMRADYDRGNLDFRSLSEDDRAGICAIYGPLATAPEPAPAGTATPAPNATPTAPQPGTSNGIDCRGEEPRFGFSRYCGENALADGCTIASPGRDEQLVENVVQLGALPEDPKPLRPAASKAAHERAKAEHQFQLRDHKERLSPLWGLMLPIAAFGVAAIRRRRWS